MKFSEWPLDAIALANRIHHLKPIGHLPKDRIATIQFRQWTKSDVKLSAGGIRSLGASHGDSATLMAEFKLLQLTRIGCDPVVAGRSFTLEFHFQRDLSLLAAVWIDEAARPKFARKGGAIAGLRITPLNNKRNGFANDPMELRVVVHTTTDQIHKVARRDRSSITINDKGDLPFGRADENGSLALEARCSGLIAAGRDHGTR